MRLKFLLFALMVIGLWVGTLTVLSSGLGQSIVEQGGRQAEVAAAAASNAASERRLMLQHAALTTLADPALYAAAGRPAKSVEPEKVLEAVKASAAGAVPEDARKELVVAFLSEAGSLSARGEGTEAVEGLDLAALSRAGADGQAVALGGAQYLFVSAPVTVPSSPEPRVAGTVVLGVPLLPKNFADGLVRRLGLLSLKILEGGKVIAEGGAKNVAVGAEKSVQQGSVGVVERGGLPALGPVQLPVLTQGDALGGSAATSIAARQALQGTPYEVLAVTSLKAPMRGLAEAQQALLIGLAVLLVLSFVWLLMMSGGPAREPEPMTDPAVKAAKRGEVLKLTYDASNQPVAANGAPAAALGVSDVPPPPEPNPDDFQFAPPPPMAQGPSSLDLPPVPDSALPPPAGTAAPDPFAAFDSDRVPTKAYPIAPGPEDPFGGAEGHGDEGFNPDATRVAAVSDELLRASARSTGEQPAASSRPVSTRVPAIAPPPSAQPVSDEAHFQDVYRDFVSTRERCGEPADGLTFDKFAAKLKKNREQLIQKYNCRTVRFQVYVKEGKAALKATPVKD